MKQIPLTQGQFAIVDDWWFDYLNQWKWFAKWNKHVNGYYAIRADYTTGKQITIPMHRVVAKTPRDLFCDHIFHNTLDNRESELRNVTRSQSQMNIRVMKNNKLGIKGIFKVKNSYRAQLTLGGKYVLRKMFKTIEEAQLAYIQAEKTYFGEFSSFQADKS
jgi:hypothetical protein